MDAAQQLFLNQWVVILSVLLLIDNLYSLHYFHYTYLFELKRRFTIVGKGVPTEYKMFLQRQIKHENGRLRTFIQSAYVPWFIVCIFANLWYLPLIITVITGITNMFYRKSYISPLVLMLNLMIFSCCYFYVIVSLFLMK